MIVPDADDTPPSCNTPMAIGVKSSTPAISAATGSIDHSCRTCRIRPILILLSYPHHTTEINNNGARSRVRLYEYAAMIYKTVPKNNPPENRSRNHRNTRYEPSTKKHNAILTSNVALL